MRKFFLCALALLLIGPVMGAQAALLTGTEGYEGDWDSDYLGYYSETEKWSGYFIGLFDGNDSEGDLKFWAETYLEATIDDYVYDKVDSVPGTGENNILSATATVFKDEGEAIGGTWATTSPYALGFYSVKSSDFWALYYVHPFQTTGTWSTTHLSSAKPNGKIITPEISHLSGLLTSVSVPEPSSMLFLGMGLVVIAGFSKKKLIKK